MIARARRALSCRLEGESGFTLVELLAAMTVLTIGFLTLAGTMGLGLKQVALGRQRQTATEVGNARIEHLRNLSYSDVALDVAPIHSTDPESPEYNVSPDGTVYDYTGAGTCAPVTAMCEVLIVGGAVAHIEDPVVVGATSMEIYQYATWVDDPDITGTQDYRRLTVIVRYKAPSVSGATRFVRVSSLFTPETVEVGGTPQGASTGSPSPSPSPSPTGTGSPTPVPCPDDAIAPTGSFSIQSGTGSQTGYTNSQTVTITFTFTDPCTPITFRFSNDGLAFSASQTYDPDNASASWTLTSGDGAKQVWTRAEDANGNAATFGPQSITLDQTRPTTPDPLGRTVSCSGTTRTVVLDWSTSTDTNFAGYRVYRSVNSGAWDALATVSGTSHTDSHSKTLDSVRYYVVGYDRAGNESLATNEVSLAKNQCS